MSHQPFLIKSCVKLAQWLHLIFRTFQVLAVRRVDRRGGGRPAADEERPPRLHAVRDAPRVLVRPPREGIRQAARLLRGTC